MTLNDIEIGEICKIIDLHEIGEMRRRIMDMGITKGAHVRVCKIAPLGDPIDIYVRGYHLSLRRNIAEKIEVAREG